MDVQFNTLYSAEFFKTIWYNTRACERQLLQGLIITRTSYDMVHSGPGRVTFFSEKFSLASVISVFHRVKFLLASGIIQSILVCIASNILAIRIMNKYCSYWYNLLFFFPFCLLTGTSCVNAALLM